jgi:hypothetical protein
MNELLAWPANSQPASCPLVARRDTGTGFSSRSDGGGYPRVGGQTPMLAHLAALGTASIDPTLAQGVIAIIWRCSKMMAIDGRPGLGGQRLSLMCAPEKAGAADMGHLSVHRRRCLPARSFARPAEVLRALAGV